MQSHEIVTGNSELIKQTTKMKKILTILALATLTVSVQAKVRLPHIICDNMVLQQQTDARLWGWATPGNQRPVTSR